ncbi:hypothetical protein LCGC14_0547560 [marine sediment metagenome]|uniref:Ribbon-helix-helix protein CopG domain-containing protein n=1 Tax=marine sediment metagenome TaxID=412755 RepID=A0A0F9RVK9_9ZZZZ
MMKYELPDGLNIEITKIIDNYNLYESREELINEAIRDKIINLTVDLKG